MKSDQPIQYKKGWVEFYKLRFAVSPDVLIPRPETELLVDEVLKFIRDSHVANAPRNDPSTSLRANVIASTFDKLSVNSAKQSLTILDLGTGAGNIAISLAKNLPDLSMSSRAVRLSDSTEFIEVSPKSKREISPSSGRRDDSIKIIASEVSEKALKFAQKNAKFHHIEDKIEFVLSDLIKNIEENPDIIVTNLPYIPSYRIPYLDSSVKDFEPHVALDGGSDGFDLYRKLFESIKEKGWNPKLIVGEIDYTQADIAQDESKKYFPKAQVEIKLDLYHKQRILLINN